MNISRKSIDIALEKIEAMDNKYSQLNEEVLNEYSVLQPALYRLITDLIRESKVADQINNGVVLLYCFIMEVIKQNKIVLYKLSESDIHKHTQELSHQIQTSNYLTVDKDGNYLIQMEGGGQQVFFEIFMSKGSVIDIQYLLRDKKNHRACIQFLMICHTINFYIGVIMGKTKNNNEHTIN